MLWNALTSCLLFSFSEDAILLCLKKCVFCLHWTFYQGKRLFLLSVFNSFLCMFFLSATKNFINSKTFLPSFIHFFWCCIVIFFNQTQDSLLLNLEIYKTKISPYDHFLGRYFWLSIVVDCYHLGSRCDAANSTMFFFVLR